MLASEKGHNAVVQTLLKDGNADANKANNNGETALFFASKHSHGPVIKTLTEKGNADVNKADKNGETALMITRLYVKLL